VIRHGVPARGWIAVVAVLVLLAAHAALLHLVLRAGLVATVVGGLAALVALKYAWWRLRR
jgi:hypothetical protein